MSKISTNPPSGFRDFLPNESANRRKIESCIRSIYQQFGFQEIYTPMVENLTTLLGKGGGSENEKLIFKILKRGEELNRSLEASSTELADLGLKFDLTLPLARFYAKNREKLSKPFKVFQIGPVWRADRPQKGRFREFYQCDVDIIGSASIGAEVDCILAIAKVLETLGLENCEVHINDRRLLQALGKNEPAGDWQKALILLDKLDKLGQEGLEQEFQKSFGRIPDGIQKIFAFSDSDFSALKEASNESIESLDSIKALLTATSKVEVKINPTLVRGQDYYTGTIFEIRHKDLSGSLAGGGRYNRLLEIFGSEAIPSFGGSIGFERLCLLQESSDANENKKPTAFVFFPLFSEKTREVTLTAAQSVRNKNISVDVFPDPVKLGNQFKYADSCAIPYAVVIGESEIATQKAKLKNMSDRTETEVSISDLPKILENLCKKNQ
ncbi:MAG: histidine--tRNA ligase [Oligoflexia bacterium]|nr:histidine--tRNA ligase [Oligoflexia bacterium]